jgi:hypothetical protein
MKPKFIIPPLTLSGDKRPERAVHHLSGGSGILARHAAMHNFRLVIAKSNTSEALVIGLVLFVFGRADHRGRRLPLVLRVLHRGKAAQNDGSISVDVGRTTVQSCPETPLSLDADCRPNLFAAC